jgi:TRAP-type transport system periplasmic protein
MKMMRSGRSWRLAGLVGVSLVLMLGVFSLCQAQQTVMKFAHQWAQGDIRDKWATTYCASLEKRTNGTVKCNVHAGGTLMNPQTQVDAMKRGALDMAVWHLGYSAGKEPVLGILDLGGVVPNPERGLRLARTEIGRRMSESAEKLGMKIVAWGFMPTSVGTTKTLVKLPKDVAGLKMRGGTKAIEQLFKASGAAITHVSTGDVYMALQTGVLDGVLTADASFLSFSTLRCPEDPDLFRRPCVEQREHRHSNKPGHFQEAYPGSAKGSDGGRTGS